MPSIEIVCIGQEHPTEFADLPFAVESGKALVSHRQPSLFQADFDLLEGCIYHLGNPRLKDPNASGTFFAWDLLSSECQGQEEESFLHFAEKFDGAVRLLMEKLLQASPSGRLVFTSDHQFGPPVAKRFAEVRLEEFWDAHDAKQLRMNALYPVAISLLSASS